jgi:hypothetical protein
MLNFNPCMIFEKLQMLLHHHCSSSAPPRVLYSPHGATHALINLSKLSSLSAAAQGQKSTFIPTADLTHLPKMQQGQECRILNLQKPF